MTRLVRVVLTASVNRFLRGIGRARSSFQGFVGAIPAGIAVASLAITGLQSAIQLVVGGLRTMRSAAQTVFNTFLEGAISSERYRTTLERITGSAEQAAEMDAFLRDEAVRLGLEYERLRVSAQQVAVALRAQNGEVDTGIWAELTTQVAAFAALRPDVPLDLWGRAISAFLAGDPTTLTRLLDVNVRQLGQLSDEARAFLNSSQQAQEQQLGTVTRLGADAAASGEGAMEALREVAQAVGATGDLLEAQAEDTQGLMDRFEATVEETFRRLGERVLPEFTEALQNLLDFLDENEEEVAAFFDALGDVTAEGLEAFMEILSGDEADNAVEMLQSATDLLRNLAKALSQVDELSDIQLFPNLEDSDFIQKLDRVLAVLEPFYDENGLFNPGAVAADSIKQQAQDTTVTRRSTDPRGNDFGATARGGPPQRERVEVDVNVTVDENGNWQAMVERIASGAANTQVGQFVSSLVGGGRENE